MKKILSIFLVACMILSMSVLAFAEDDGTNAELESQGYKPVSTEDEFLTTGGKIYLTQDIVFSSPKTGNQKNDGKIDGNGHTVTFAGGIAIISWSKNVEVRNLKMEGSVEISDGSTTAAVWEAEDGSSENRHYGPFAIHGIDGNLVVQNCESEVDITINNTKLPGSIGGFMGKSHGSNATWKNVKYSGTMNLPASPMTNEHMEMRTIGGIAGMSGANLIAENVNVSAVMNVGATEAAGIGGIFGITRDGNNNFKNCSFNGEINFSGTCLPEYGIGGIAGWTMGDPFIAEGLNNNGKITATNTANLAPVGGIFGMVDAKGSNMEFRKVVNTGAVTGTKTAGGVVGEFVSGAELTTNEKVLKYGFMLNSVMNTGNVEAPMAAGGLIGKINQLMAFVDGTSTDPFVIEFSNVVNAGNIKATAVTVGEPGDADYVAGAEGAGAAVGVMPAAPEEGVYNFTVKTIYTIGTVSGENSTPIIKVPTEWLLGETAENFYCQDVTGSHFGEKKTKAEIDAIIATINFVSLNTYNLSVAMSGLDGKLESDYEADTWKAAADAIAVGDGIIKGTVEADEAAVTAATEAINAAVAALKLKTVDKATLTAILDEAKKLNKDDYRGDTWRKLDRALTDAEVAFVKQSDLDAAVLAIREAIDGLQLKDTDAPTEEVTEAPTSGVTEAATTEAPTEPAKKGCGGAITATAAVLTAVLALGAGVAFKKKED